MKRCALAAVVVLLAATVPVLAQNAPRADHHQHLFSPAIVALVNEGTKASSELQPITATDLVALLDSAGVRRALVLSVAYIYGSPTRALDDEYARVMAENDWTAAQAALYPSRLRAFCSFNPLKDYALEELTRCAHTPGLHRGIALHFGNSDVQLENPEHLARLRQIFHAANYYHMAIVLHMRASISRQRSYGTRQARIFLETVIPAAPDVPIQIAHLAGTGPGYNDPAADSVLSVFADAIQSKDPRTRNLWFDIASVVDPNMSLETAELVVKRIRQIGVRRVLFGSDAALGNNLRPRDAWTAFRALPLTDQELQIIANNLAPYLR